MPSFSFTPSRLSLLRPLVLLPALVLGLVLAGAFGCPPAAQAASIYIEGGGGGGGGGDNNTDPVGRGGGGNGGRIGTSAGGATAGTGETDGTSAGGAGGQGGNASANKDGSAGGVGGSGLNTLVTNHGVTAGVTQTGEDGGNGGSAAADDTDTAVAAVGGPDTVSIVGGSGGNGGSGNGYSGTDPTQGSVGGRGGDGGNAELDWGTNNHTITSLDVLAGANGAAALGWTNTDTGISYYSSGGVGGYAKFFLNGNLTTTGTVNVQARGNYARYESNNLTAGAATMLIATNSQADMLIHGNASLTTLTVTSIGSGLASFLADGSGIVTTTGAVNVIAGSSGNVLFQSEQYFGGSATNITVGTDDAGNADMIVNTAGANQVQNVGDLIIISNGSGNARFSAPNAATVQVTGSGQYLIVDATNSGNAGFSAPAAAVSILDGNLTVDSSTSTGGAATFVSQNLSVNGSVTVSSGATGAAGLTTGALTASTITLTKGAADLTFDVTTLDVTGGSNTILLLDKTTAAGVNIGTVELGGGNAFVITSMNNGTGTFTNLNVTGTGGVVDAPDTQLFPNVSLAGGSSLQSIHVLNFSNMRVLGQGASYTGDLNAAGKTLTFDLPAGLTPGQVMLNVTGDADITDSTVNLAYQSARPAIGLGESLTLLDVSGALSGTAANATAQTAGGDIYALLVENKQLLARLQSIAPTSPQYERLKAFAEGRTAALAFVNQGADLILNEGFGSALFATTGPGFQFGAFAAGSGGWSRYDTGSYVDVSGFSMLTGVALGNDLGPGRATLGVFFEGGWGNYDSYNSFSNYASVDGDGDTSYYGGGILGRYDVTDGAAAGLYVDASARLGRADADFNSDDINYNGNSADFDSDSMYWGAHAGLGYQWNLTEKALLDVSGKFIWTRQESDSVDVHGDNVHFDTADSLRTRLGARLTYAVNDYLAPYIGAYWEHEFDGEQGLSVNDEGLDSPDLKGDTGVGELGLTLRPAPDSGLSFDLGVQGYTGVREGVTGSLQVKYEF